MTTPEPKVVQLSPEQIKQLEQYEGSIEHFSVEHARLVLQTQATLRQIDGLYAARQQVVNEFLKDHGIDATTILNVNLTPEGKTTVTFKPVKPTLQVVPPAQEVAPTA